MLNYLITSPQRAVANIMNRRKLYFIDKLVEKNTELIEKYKFYDRTRHGEKKQSISLIVFSFVYSRRAH